MKRRGFRYRVRQAWRRSLWITGPIGVTYLVWCFAVFERYRALGVRYDMVPGQSVMLEPIMRWEWHRIARQFQLLGAVGAKPSSLRKVHLFLPEREERRLNHRLPESGRHYVEGALLFPGGDIDKVDLRYRGDTAWHWAFDKRSWRIKTSKDKLWNGVRRLNLIIPKSEAMVEMQLSYALASQLGLLSPRSEVSELFINGKNRGIHVLVEQLGEPFLRSQLRMPGDLYAGELIGDTAIQRWPLRLFQMPGAWDKVAINNHFPDEQNVPLQTLCEALALEGEARSQALAGLLDWEAFARYAVLRAVIQTGHIDEYHNWRLYYDPWKNRFEPVVWDPMGWLDTWAPQPDYPEFLVPLFSELDRALALEPRFRLAMERVWEAFFRSERDQDLLAQCDDLLRSVAQAAVHDPHLAFAARPLSPDDVREAGEKARARIAGYLESLRARKWNAVPRARGRVLPGDRADVLQMEWELTGEASVQAWIVQGPEGWARRAQCFWESSDGATIGAQARPGQADTWLTLSGPFAPGLRLVEDATRHPNFSHISEPLPQRWRLRVEGVPLHPDPQDFTLYAIDAQGRQQALPAGDAAWAGTFSWPAVAEEGPLETLRWSGETTVEGVQVLRADLEIEAGTTVRLGPGATVIVQGRVTASGRPEAPIRFVRLQDAEPWGAFAIRTERGDGSHLQHVSFEGGSGWKHPLEEYSAMFSVHDVDDLVLEHCRFDRSAIVDDMVHVVYGDNLRFSDCSFDRALSDAVDLDACSGTVERCRFVRSGNDGLDLMMSQVAVLDSVFEECGDKGISVGEGSQLWLEDSRVHGCVFGVQVKDGSAAWIVGGRFANNGTAWDAYRKNWQYGAGGHGVVHGAQLDEGETIASADKASRWYLHDVELPADWRPSRRVRRVESLALEQPELQRFARSEWMRARLAQREESDSK